MNAHAMPVIPEPPSHIKGRLHGWTPAEVAQERNAWIVQQHQNGATWAQIGKALGIGPDPVRIAAQKTGYKVPRKNDPGTIHNRVRKIGIKLGYFGTVFFGLPDDVQNKLINAAIKQKCTVAEVMARHYVETAK